MLDDRPGSRAAVSIARPGPLLVCAHVRATADAADLTGLRVLLTADLLFRAAEVGGLQVLVKGSSPASPPGRTTWSGPPLPSASTRLCCLPLTLPERGRVAWQ